MFRERALKPRLIYRICKACRESLAASKPKCRGFADTNVTGPQRKPSQLLPKTPARTRFAPSPTGHLHLGSLRTALFNYLLAKATGGQFILRIEDTDAKRTVDGAEDRIYEDLEWAGLQWDEGPKVGGLCGPYRQSERLEFYTKHANELLSSGRAYRCFCSRQRLNQLAQSCSKLGLPIEYDRLCLGISATESDLKACNGSKFTVRLKVPESLPTFTDLVYGEVGRLKGKKKTKTLNGRQAYEDPILLKSDGLPTYHLANVVDDHYMNISHVIRAVEWIPSTPKHLIIYNALGWEPPTYAHVGLLQDVSRQKLSKRDLDIDIRQFKNEGFFPEAIVNHVALLGWSHSQQSDLLPMQELIRCFDLKFTKGNTIVNFQKLGYLQRLYAQRYVDRETEEFEVMINAIIETLQKDSKLSGTINVPGGQTLHKYVSSILKSDSRQYSFPKQFCERNRNFFVKNLNELPSLEVTHADQGQIATAVRSFADVPDDQWKDNKLKNKQEEITGSILKATLFIAKEPVREVFNEELGLRNIASDLSRYLRWAIMASLPGPPMAKSMELLGKHDVLSRLEKAEKNLKAASVDNWVQ